MALDSSLRTKLRNSLINDRRIPDYESRTAVLRGVRRRWNELKERRMALNDLLEEEIRRQARRYPCFDNSILVMSARETLDKHLQERKAAKVKNPVSEKEVLQAIDRLKGHADEDKGIRDILYALTDLSPFESARNLAKSVLDAARRR